MKKIFNIRINFTFLIIVSLSFVFSSCDDDGPETIYFKCQLNGEKYKTYWSGISFVTKPQPTFTIEKIGDYNMTYCFSTKISPEDLSDDYFSYYLNFTIYRNEPLLIGETYFIPKRTVEENPTWEFETKPVLKDYVSLAISGDYDSYYGSGTIQLIEYNEKENCYKGIVEFEFDLPIDKGGRNEKSILKGEFRVHEY